MNYSGYVGRMKRGETLTFKGKMELEEPGKGPKKGKARKRDEKL